MGMEWSRRRDRARRKRVRCVNARVGRVECAELQHPHIRPLDTTFHYTPEPALRNKPICPDRYVQEITDLDTYDRSITVTRSKLCVQRLGKSIVVPSLMILLMEGSRYLVKQGKTAVYGRSLSRSLRVGL
jgi:hypothetical protein